MSVGSARRAARPSSGAASRPTQTGRLGPPLVVAGPGPDQPRRPGAGAV